MQAAEQVARMCGCGLPGLVCKVRCSNAKATAPVLLVTPLRTRLSSCHPALQVVTCVELEERCAAAGLWPPCGRREAAECMERMHVIIMDVYVHRLHG